MFEAEDGGMTVVLDVFGSVLFCCTCAEVRVTVIVVEVERDIGRDHQEQVCMAWEADNIYLSQLLIISDSCQPRLLPPVVEDSFFWTAGLLPISLLLGSFTAQMSPDLRLQLGRDIRGPLPFTHTTKQTTPQIIIGDKLSFALLTLSQQLRDRGLLQLERVCSINCSFPQCRRRGFGTLFAPGALHVGETSGG